MSLRQANVIEFAPCAARTTTYTGTGVDMQDYDGEIQFILTSAAGTGTTPTLNVKLQESDALGSGYTDISGATFAEVTDAGDITEMIGLNIGENKRYIRVVGTIAGGTPSFSFAVAAVGVLEAGRNASQAV